MSLTVGICVTTHNRCAELERTLAAVAALEPAPNEVVVTVDGCNDGTLEMLRSVHQEARVIVHDQARGSIPSRNEMAEACSCDVFISLDDDSYPLETDFIERVRKLFAAQPKLAVASFPQRTEEFPETLACSGFGPPRFVGSFANSGAAIRREVFLQLRGYPSHFFHAYEEPDFALRCLAAGFRVRYETSASIRHHFTSAQRNELRTHHRHARNELWSVLMRCPAPQLFAVGVFRAARQLGYAARRGWSWLIREPLWWVDCIRGVRHCLAQREPVPWSRYRAWMQLVREPLFTEAEWLARFESAR